MSRIRRGLDSLGKACEQRGIGFRWTETQHVAEILPTWSELAKRIWMSEVVVEEDITTAGFRIVAAVDREKGETHLLECPSMQDLEDETLEYSALDMDPTCSECGKNQGDDLTYAVLDEVTGHPIQVGACCLRHYANDLPKHTAQRYVSLLCRMSWMSSDAYYNTIDHRHWLIDAKDFMTYTFDELRRNGYSKYRAMGDKSTANVVIGRLAQLSVKPSFIADVAYLDSPEDQQDATTALEWAASGCPGAPDTPWKERAMQVVSAIQDGLINQGRAGMLASVAYVWDRTVKSADLVREAQWVSCDPTGNWLGKEGERITRLIRRISHLSTNNYFVNGHKVSSRMYGLLTTEGDIAIWRTAAYLPPVDKDHPIIMTATVKKNLMYDGRRQTVVTRGRLRDPEEKPDMTKQLLI